MDLSNIRVREHFGLIANDSHVEQFSFLISPPKGRAGLEKHDYILVDHPLAGEACQILAIIKDISSYEEIASSTINDKRAKMLATAHIIGYFDIRKEDKPINELLVPPNPGSRVYLPLKGFLQDILNRNLKGKPFKTPVEIGIFEGLSVEESANNGSIKCFLDAEEVLSKHSLITAITGSGKTLIAQKILKNINEKTSCKIVIFDPHGEYESVSNEKVTLTSKLEEENLTSSLKKSTITRLNGKQLSNKEKNAVYSEILLSLVKLRIKEKISPLLIIIEDAENLQESILDEAITEGAKIQIALALLTTHPSKLGGKILSNMSNQIIGKTIVSEDMQFLKNIVGNYDISSLSVGEWIINGVNKTRPMKTLAE
jgi:DNA helicase HerA-like ATPase